MFWNLRKSIFQVVGINGGLRPGGEVLGVTIGNSGVVGQGQGDDAVGVLRGYPRLIQLHDLVLIRLNRGRPVPHGPDGRVHSGLEVLRLPIAVLLQGIAIISVIAGNIIPAGLTLISQIPKALDSRLQIHLIHRHLCHHTPQPLTIALNTPQYSSPLSELPASSGTASGHQASGVSSPTSADCLP